MPENRARWMKLLGNSVSVPVIEVLAKAIIDTGVFDEVEDFSTHEIPIQRSIRRNALRKWGVANQQAEGNN